jgi:hypothetical protein
MPRILMASLFALLPTTVLAAGDGWCVEGGSDNGPDYVCPSDSDVCTHVTMTRESAHADTGGRNCHCQQWIVAPDNKYFKDPPVMTVVSRTSERNTECGIVGKQGVTTKRVPITKNSSVTLTLVKKYFVRTHVETGSGPQAIGRTCHIHCQFSAEVVDLPN